MSKEAVSIVGYALGVLALIFLGASDYTTAVAILLFIIAFARPIQAIALRAFVRFEEDEAAETDDMRRRLYNQDRQKLS